MITEDFEFGLRPIGEIKAYPPACKPMAYKPAGWKRPRREVGADFTIIKFKIYLI